MTVDVVEESQAATHSATTATIGTNAGEYLKDISVHAHLEARFGFVHTVRQSSDEVLFVCITGFICDRARDPLALFSNRRAVVFTATRRACGRAGYVIIRSERSAGRGVD